MPEQAMPAMNTISEAEIHQAAKLVITRYGCDAIIEAARMVDRMLELGDVEATPYGAASAAGGEAESGSYTKIKISIGVS